MSRCALRSWMARATSSLPVPVSPVMSTVLLVSATQLGALDDLLHRAAAADDAVVIELLVALAEQVAVLGAQPLVIERAPDDDQQLVDLERLLQVVERAELHRLDRALDRGVRRHHQRSAARSASGVDADVLADQIEAAQLAASRCRRPAGRTAARRAAAAPARGLVGLDDLVAGVAQRAAERLQNLLFVVDEQDRAARVVMRSSGERGAAARCGFRCRGPACSSRRWCRRGLRRCSWRWPGRGRCRRAWS